MEAIECGFFVRLVYICVDGPERSIQRVRERVARGGHDVPDRDVRRRYVRSLANAEKIVRIVQQALVLDNSGAEPVLAMEIRAGKVLSTVGPIPVWAAGLL